MTWSKGKHHRRPHGDPTATERVFVNAEGVKRAYKFKASDTRVFEEQSLERQLNAAAFLPTTKEDTDSYSLGEAERRTPTFRAPAGPCAPLGELVADRMLSSRGPRLFSLAS